MSEADDRFRHIAPYYEALFPARPAQLDFLEESAVPGAPERFLDVACGTGQQMEALIDHGHETWGIDLDESMIARLKGRRPDLRERVVLGDMRNTDSLLRPIVPGPMGVVYCIGNSLVQLTDPDDIERALESFRSILDEAGTFVAQIVNFDRVLRGDWGMLPPIERTLPEMGTCRLERTYALSPAPGCVRFSTRLDTPESTEERCHDLYALRREEFETLLRTAGFESIVWCGNYDDRPWDENSPATIVRASRLGD